MKTVISCPVCSKKIRVPKGKNIKFVCPQCGKRLEFHDKHGENILIKAHNANFLEKEKAKNKAFNWSLVVGVISLNLLNFFGLFLGLIAAIAVYFLFYKIFLYLFYTSKYKN